jgi:hypothetical protein
LRRWATTRDGENEKSWYSVIVNIGMMGCVFGVLLDFREASFWFDTCIPVALVGLYTVNSFFTPINIGQRTDRDILGGD